jgi:hypothetical protein
VSVGVRVRERVRERGRKRKRVYERERMCVHEREVITGWKRVREGDGSTLRHMKVHYSTLQYSTCLQARVHFCFTCAHPALDGSFHGYRGPALESFFFNRGHAFYSLGGGREYV